MTTAITFSISMYFYKLSIIKEYGHLASFQQASKIICKDEYQ